MPPTLCRQGGVPETHQYVAGYWPLRWASVKNRWICSVVRWQLDRRTRPEQFLRDVAALSPGGVGWRLAPPQLPPWDPPTIPGRSLHHMELCREPQAPPQRRQQRRQAQLPGVCWGEGGSVPAGHPPPNRTPTPARPPVPSHTHPGRAGRGVCSAPAGLLVRGHLVRMRPPVVPPPRTPLFPPSTFPVYHGGLQQPQRLLGAQRPPQPAGGGGVGGVHGWDAPRRWNTPPLPSGGTLRGHLPRTPPCVSPQPHAPTRPQI